MTSTPLSELRGLIPDDEGEVLAELAATVPHDQAIVELGSYKGKSTCYLASGAKRGGGAVVFAIDAWDLDGNETGRHGYADAFPSFVAQVKVCGFTLAGEGMVVPKDRIDVLAVRAFSVDAARAWTGPVGMLYIDADHAYESVWGDFWSWYPHLVDGAVVAFDDWRTPRNPGVEQAVARIAKGGHLPDLTIHAERLAVAHVRKEES